MSDDIKNSINIENISYAEALYEEWKRNRTSVPEQWQRFFEDFDGDETGTPTESPSVETSAAGSYTYKQGRVNSLIWAYRDVGYIHADINPLHGYMPKELWYVYKTIEGNYESLSLKEFGLSEEDMDSEFVSSKYLEPSTGRLSAIIDTLRQVYCSFMGVEFLFIQNKPIRKWLIRQIEEGNNRPRLSDEQKRKTQEDLIKALEFENFLHSHFVGQKRFSLEGSEVLLPALHYLIDLAASRGFQEIVLGMSHRGRLNVLANIIDKPFEQIFETFEHTDESPTYGESGDVKYHLGYDKDHINEDGTRTHIDLVSNASHLESVDPVVQGKTRALQRLKGDKTRKKVMAVQIHGDAAFSGQGTVAETFNLSKLKGYETGGTIHIIVNNQIGFTTAARDLRSTFFPTDIAKALPVPVFHVNGDRPEYVLRAMELAFDYRQKFGYDAIVDIFCYRKYGHNEADDPSFTHPWMYSLIDQSPGVTALYGKTLEESGVFSSEEQEEFKKHYHQELNGALESGPKKTKKTQGPRKAGGVQNSPLSETATERVETAISEETLRHIVTGLTSVPQDFTVHSRLRRIISRRETMIEGEGEIDWGTGEAIAFGSLLLDGTSIRLSGEDSSRGTFSHRHSVWWDTSSEQPVSYIPLKHLSDRQGEFIVYDSPLSEMAVLGFEFGYSLIQKEMLTLWEAQFGDFANGAQVMIDQYIAASESKWDRLSGLVMLLPHGFEGQGPEHSYGYLDRFLHLCGESNLQVCNLTTPAQYFHVLRRQMKRVVKKPLIIMAPKSLLRHKSAVSKTEHFTSGNFEEVIGDEYVNANRVRKVLLCSGKIYYDLHEAREEKNKKECAVIRLEQFYPYPEQKLNTVLEAFPNVETYYWVQEEPRNRGGWRYILERFSDSGIPIRYIGRAASASPATGFYTRHVREQQQIVEDAFS